MLSTLFNLFNPITFINNVYILIYFFLSFPYDILVLLH